MSDAVITGWKNRLAAWQMPAWGVPLLLFLVCVASYGLPLPALGFYWDDFPISWIGETYGSAGLERYFSTNRPFWGWLYRLTVPLLGSQQPVVWQLFNLFWRWLSAVALWGLVRLAWPRHTHLAVWTALLFIIYPAFRQQPIALLYSHFFIVFAIFLFSQILTLLALRRFRGRYNTGGFWALTLLALLSSLYNLLAMEYFFILEVVRLAFIWIGLGEDSHSWRQRGLRTLLAWLPYLLVFIAVIIWRMFFFSFQTENYEMVFFHRLRLEGLAAIFTLLQNILYSFWVAGPGGWVNVFLLPNVVVLGRLTTLLYAALVILSSVLLIFVLLRLPVDKSQPDHRQAGLQMVFVGLFACLAAGWPFWLIEVLPGGNFPGDRFTLPFVLGMSLIFAGILAVVIPHLKFQSIILGLLLALAVGYQFQVANEYRRDWQAAQRFFWQLAWRVPALEPGTLLLSNVLPLEHYTDNSLTAPLNRIYAPALASQSLAYLLYYPERRLGKSLISLEPGTPVKVDYLAAQFSGDTAQAIVLVYQPPGCLRILDPQLDWESLMLLPDLRSPARLSDINRIIPAGEPDLPPGLFGSEPTRNWCYFFEKADLARQQGDWETVAVLADQAFSIGDYPNDPAERIPFIEGFAHVGRWSHALEQSRQAADVAPAMQPVLCRLWQRIEEATPPNPEQAAALSLAREELQCEP